MYLLFCSTKERSHGIDGPALVGVQCGSGRRIFVFLGVGMAMLHPELFFLLHSLGPCPPGPSSPSCLSLSSLSSLLRLSPRAGHGLRTSTIDAELGC